MAVVWPCVRDCGRSERIIKNVGDEMRERWGLYGKTCEIERRGVCEKGGDEK